MHAEVLESARFAKIVLTAQRTEIQINASGNGMVTLLGTLVIHGGERNGPLLA